MLYVATFLAGFVVGSIATLALIILEDVFNGPTLSLEDD